MKERIKKIVRLSLQKNNWGIYFRGRPLIEMPVNGEPSIYKLNEVRLDELEGAISNEIDLMIEEINKEGATQCQNETMNRSSDVN